LKTTFVFLVAFLGMAGVDRRADIRGMRAGGGWGVAEASELPASAPPITGKEFRNSIGMQMVWLSPGYWVGKHEVTQAEYEKVMVGNPSRFRGPRHPVEQVSWYDAVEFCRKLTEREEARLGGRWEYSLPTEQQWEYYVADAQLRDAVHGRWQGGKPMGTSDVGSLGANRLGLHDVRGNVWEWCLDWWSIKKDEHVLRGGAWDLSHPDDLAVAYRPVAATALYVGNGGFRCVLIKAPQGARKSK
jgi:formylglycine-generating enzyme required for sulfatase activity